jgi:hypothetical protein
MLNQCAARAIHYDPAADEATIEVARADSGAFSRPSSGVPRSPRVLEGQLLLDADGFLVGVDLGGEAVVMLGPHEKVARVSSAEVIVAWDAAGAPVEVRVRGAKEALRGSEKNPYV